MPRKDELFGNYKYCHNINCRNIKMAVVSLSLVIISDKN